MTRPGNVDLSVVILNYNTREHLRACLRSIQAEGSTSLSVNGAPLVAEAVVVDNASTDGSAQMVEREFPWVSVIRAPYNGGFAYGNNLALGTTLGDAVLLLNPDTLVEPGALGELLSRLKARPEAAVVGPKLVRPDGSLHLAARRAFPTPLVSFFRLSGLSAMAPRSHVLGRYNLANLHPDQPSEVDAVCGACMLVRCAAIDQVGGLDERYFMYAEDLDWCLRFRAAGWTIRYEPSAVVRHQHSTAARARRLATTYHFFRSMELFYRKHYARQYNPLVTGLVAAGIYLGMGLAFVRLVVTPRANRPVGH